jgi:hypothetical protein
VSETMVYTGGSARAFIAQLSEGESFSQCRRLPITRLSREKVSREITDLRNTVNGAMQRAAKETGAEYTIDTVQLLTASRDLMLVAVVTRLA